MGTHLFNPESPARAGQCQVTQGFVWINPDPQRPGSCSASSLFIWHWIWCHLSHTLQHKINITKLATNHQAIFTPNLLSNYHSLIIISLKLFSSIIIHPHWALKHPEKERSSHWARSLEKYRHKKCRAYHLHFRSIKAFFPHLAPDTVTTSSNGPRWLRR